MFSILQDQYKNEVLTVFILNLVVFIGYFIVLIYIKKIMRLYPSLKSNLKPALVVFSIVMIASFVRASVTFIYVLSFTFDVDVGLSDSDIVPIMNIF